MTPPKYSMIVPTYNRVEELKELLPSISLMNENQLLELIIIDDGSTDGTESYLNSFKSQFSITYRKQSNKGPGAARNYGMSIAQGKYFLFVDSDCILPKDYLIQIDKFLNQSVADAFGGKDSFHPSFSPLLKAIDYSMTSFIGTGGTRGSSKSVTKFFPRSFNMGFHRKVYEKIGEFNALRHGQDMDYSARIYNAGFQVSLIPDSVVFHKRRTSLKRFFKQIYNWGVARINLSSIHEGFLKPIHLAPALILLISLVILIFVLVGIIPFKILFFGLLIVTLIALFAFFQSLFKYSSIKVGLLSIVTLYIQVVAYGMGSLSGLFQRLILGKKVSTGFSKNYYK
jgi:glycosyltransferase involved in cell wall biosynthesis